MIKRLFLEHPESLGETYFEHQRRAFGFGGSMVLAGLACIMHGLVPALFEKTGSSAVAQLNERMSQRLRLANASGSASSDESIRDSGLKQRVTA